MNQQIRRLSRAVVIALMLAAAHAAVPLSPAGATSPALSPSISSSPASGILQMVLALLCVLGAIFLTLWAMRKVQTRAMGEGAALKVVSGVMVGPKERVVVVEIQDTWLVLGVTASEIGMLHSMNKPVTCQEAEQIQVSAPFAQRLSQAIRSLNRQGVGETQS